MSTASVVPETWELSGDDAIQTLRGAPMRHVMADAVRRFRWADGFSHSRALAFQTVLAFVPGVIVLVGTAVLTRSSALSRTIVGTIVELVPGPVGQVFKQAADQGAGAASQGGNIVALLTGGLAMAISGTTAFGQVERGANRIYGVEKDRPTLRKYALATALALSVGLCLGLAFVLLATGRAVTTGIDAGPARTAWIVGRWPLGIVLLALAYSVIFKMSPKRRQPALSWLMVGSLISVVLNVAGSIGLSLYLNASGSFGDTYGPLAGFLGVMIWAYVGSIGLYFGLAVNAQLEAVRAGRASPQSTQKVAGSESASVDDPDGATAAPSGDASTIRARAPLTDRASS